MSLRAGWPRRYPRPPCSQSSDTSHVGKLRRELKRVASRFCSLVISSGGRRMCRYLPRTRNTSPPGGISARRRFGSRWDCPRRWRTLKPTSRSDKQIRHRWLPLRTKCTYVCLAPREARRCSVVARACLWRKPAKTRQYNQPRENKKLWHGLLF